MRATPRFALGVDLGGTRLRAAAVTESGEIIANEEMPTEVNGGPDRILADILRLVETVSTGIANAFDQLEGGIRAYIAARALPPFRTMPIRRAELGDLSGVVGTAALAFAHAKRKA